MKIIRPAKIILGGAALLSIAGLFLAGCNSATSMSEGKMPAAQHTDAAIVKGGAQLWAENCTRCHNIRSPSIYSDANWDIAMHHMRIRANLTADESNKILEFLKSAN